MKVFTQQEFDEFPVIGGFKQCSTGDYSVIREFPMRCDFGEQSLFSSYSCFVDHCKFGINCVFGNECYFGSGCFFAVQCSFDSSCRFGDYCSFGDQCEFGEGCLFGDCCSFDPGCRVEGVHCMQSLFRVVGLGRFRRLTYFFKLTDGNIFVRCGCFSGFLDNFLKQVERTHGYNAHAKAYKMAADLAKFTFE